MKDKVFYPIFILVIMGIIALALLPSKGYAVLSPQQIIKTGYVLQGSDLHKLTAAPATIVQIVDRQGEEGIIAILSSNIPRKMATPSAGVFGTLGSNYEQAFGGRKIEITITARRARKDPLDKFKAGYFTSGAGDSGWREFVLEDEYKDFSFSFSPKPPSTPGNDYIGIWPGDAGDGARMELKSIRIKVID